MEHTKAVDVFVIDDLVKLKFLVEHTVVLWNSTPLDSSTARMHRSYFELYGSVISQYHYDLAGENLKDM